MKKCGAGEELINIIIDLYTNSITQYKTSAGLSTPCVATTWVKQGDPLSGVFITAIDFIIRTVHKEGSCRDPSLRNLFNYILAYVDDVLLMAKDAITLQALLNLINKLAKCIGLAFNPKKCVSMHYSNKAPAGCRLTTFNIDGANIPCFRDGCSAIFLGKPVGAFIPRDTVPVENLKQTPQKILTSKLDPWQRIDCLKTFFYPSALFLMRTDQSSQNSLAKH